MNIAHISLHGCIRAYKIAWIQRERGHRIHMLAEAPMPWHAWRDFNAYHLFYSGHPDGNAQIDISNLAQLVEGIDPCVDLYHVHNEPDWPVHLVRQISQKPIVWDVHDMVSLRHGTETDPWEDKALAACNGISTISREYAENLRKRANGKPVWEILSCVPEKLMPKVRRIPFEHGLVYQGGLKGKKEGFSNMYDYRNWQKVFLALNLMNIRTSVYAASEEDFSEYTGTHFYGPLKYDELLKNLSAHECGLTGSPIASSAFKGAMPNKMWEYMAAGIPQIVWNAPDAGMFIENLGFGKSVESVDEIPAAMDELWTDKYRDRIWSLRHHWTAESQVSKVTALYAEILGTTPDKLDAS